MIKTLLILTFINFSAKAGVKRISETEIDISKPITIHMTTQGPTVVDLPCNISHSLLGIHKDLVVKIGPDNKKTFSIWLKDDDSQPSTINVRCDRRMFVFDVIPNRYSHQSYIDITDYFYEEMADFPKIREVYSKRKLISDSSKMKKMKKRLIKQGEF